MQQECEARTILGEWFCSRGVEAAVGRVTLVDSSVTGSGTSALCSSMACADLLSAKQPKLRGASSGGTSAQSPAGDNPGETWGVCAND
jgi:hypothetical protein